MDLGLRPPDNVERDGLMGVASEALYLKVGIWRINPRWGTNSREYLFGATVRILAERARDARKDADGLACQAWTVCSASRGRRSPPQPLATP